jgi:superfamily II DNA or RNA helicase
MRLEELTPGTLVRGLVPGVTVKIIQVEWFGDQAVKVTFEGPNGAVRNRLIYRSDEPSLELVEPGRAWSFSGDGEMFRLASEAQRIRFAYLFDPYLALSTSLIEPLPHQITAVYGEMLPRQPLRFLLADDPGAGKTIMAGLLIKELLIRGDLERCLVVAPGNLVEQWQDELAEKFHLDFAILTRDRIEASRSGNPFDEAGLWIARLDTLSRNEDLQAKLFAAREWDLVVCDEAHRMSASYFGSEIKYTQRYQLGQRLSGRCRHFLLMTATPHNGKEADFQLFMALLDGDRFEGRFREGAHTADVSDMLRRLTKEELKTFDGRDLFPPRFAYTVNYKLSDAETDLYEAVTDYVRNEMNRAERLAEGDQRRQNVGFALQILQRRLASSPAAIHESLRRRRERLERRLDEERLLQRGRDARLGAARELTVYRPDFFEDVDDRPEDEIEAAEERLVDSATAAQTIAEVESEIATLADLEQRAKALRRSGTDTKWRELQSILDHPLMTDAAGNRRKLIVFTEPRDTLAYLADKIRTRLGRAEAVVEIHGGLAREARRTAVHAFLHDPAVMVMVANDAAGEGVNLQRAHLMVNYDLPWNPNRLEQRFGRIHRIGQTEVCHLWNLVANETREGAVYARLLEKLEAAREALGGRVYDVLGQLFEQKALKDLLIDAIRYGERPEIKAGLLKAVDDAVDQAHLIELLDRRALVQETLPFSRIQEIREQMERAHAQRLQPHYIESFFCAAFERLGGRMHRREAGRYEVSRVPGALRERDRQIGTGAPVLARYERICFDKAHVPGPPVAAFVCPGHPLLDATIDLTLERHRDLMKQGAILIDPRDAGEQLRILVTLDQAIEDGRVDRHGRHQIVARGLHFVELIQDGRLHDAGPAPYLDYRPARAAEREAITPRLDDPWLAEAFESRVVGHAVQHLVPRELEEVRARRLPQIDKIEREVQARLKREINYWDHRAEVLKDQERAGKQPRMNPARAQARADELSERLKRRMAELDDERRISAVPPVVLAGALVVPVGLLRKLGVAEDVEEAPQPEIDPARRAEIERVAMAAVMAAERALGFAPRDVSRDNCGYDIESRDPAGTGHLRFVEVKGLGPGNDRVTITRNELLRAKNSAEWHRLAIVRVERDRPNQPAYISDRDFGEVGFAEVGRMLRLSELLEIAREPH